MAYGSYDSTPRLPQQHTVRNDGAGPYAVFYCDKCRREFRSQPVPPDNTPLKEFGEQTFGNLLRHIPFVGETVANSVIDSVTNSMAQAGSEVMGNLLHNIPVVGDTMANTVAAADPRRAQTLTPQQLAAAWQQVQSNFRECPTCQQLVCATDFDQASGYCNDHKPQPATPLPPMPTPAAPAAAAPVAAARACASCGADTQGAKFCPNCGAKQEAPVPTHCPSCGTEAKGAKFCPNCGAKLG